MSEPASSPVRPRDAASLIVLRHGAAGPEVLMGMRGARHRFMPNRLVFPGGAVDPGDADAPAASELSPAVLRRLTASAAPVLARALAIAATRELEEETGLTLGHPPGLAGLDYLCRAITPASFPMRFDARFLVVAASGLTGTLAGSGELEDLRWHGLGDALALDLALVTRRVLERLGEWLAMSEAERAGRTATPALVERTWRME